MTSIAGLRDRLGRPTCFSLRITLLMLVIAIGVVASPMCGLADSPIWVAIYDHSDGSANGPKNLERFLTREAGFRCERLKPEEIQAGRLSAFDLLIVPGGSGSKQAANLGEKGRENIREFVRGGKGYVGICAGSYLASSDYDWSLHLLNAKVFDRAHWARGTGSVELNFTKDGKSALRHSDDSISVYYGQGPLLVPDTKPNLPKYEVLAEYASEIAKKGAPTGVMIGTTAVARAPYGEGRVICFSPHPEGSRKTEHLMLAGVVWASGKTPVSAESSSSTSDEAPKSADQTEKNVAGQSRTQSANSPAIPNLQSAPVQPPAATSSPR